MMMKKTVIALVLSTSLPAAALAQGSSGNQANTVSNVHGTQSGQQFLEQVARDSFNEINEALVAEQKAQDPAVRAYARLMINDHTMLISQLSAVAGQTSFDLNSVKQNEGSTSEMQGSSKGQFDRTFINHEVKQHEESVGHWQHEANAKSDKSSPVESFAMLGLPVQREHLALAQAIQVQLEHGSK